MCGPNDDPTTTYDIAKESPMRYEDFGPVANPDGSPTQTTIDMLAGTGRDPQAFARGAVIGSPERPAMIGGIPFVARVATGDELTEAYDGLTNWLDRVPAQDGDL